MDGWNEAILTLVVTSKMMSYVPLWDEQGEFYDDGMRRKWHFSSWLSN